MTNPIAVLALIRLAGGSVVVEDQDLRITAPAGTLTQEHRSILAEHKADLVRLLAPVDPEREARVWVEGLSPVEAEVVVSTAISEWTAITSEGLDQDRDLASAWDQGIEPIECEKCGSVMLWWDLAGRAHCQLCDPMVRFDMLRLTARRLRREARKAPRGGGGDEKLELSTCNTTCTAPLLPTRNSTTCYEN